MHIAGGAQPQPCEFRCHMISDWKSLLLDVALRLHTALGSRREPNNVRPTKSRSLQCIPSFRAAFLAAPHISS